MALAPGTRIGPYEVQVALGAGGMGEVYRARDTKLGRDVALKVLPDAFVSDPERVARFQREAKTLASLNHPNIGGIYGLEEANGVTALVLELVEGPTLADRIAQGPIDIDEALPLAKQIAEALGAAHEHGVIHRDLKPANIKTRPDGTVKVLDFGLAKAVDPARASTDASQSPTITSPAMTRMGVILGTAAYMSPEQARGNPVDKRTDIWAFGVVLYEMVTGRRLFEGNTVSDTLAAVLTQEPDWERVPRRIRPLLRRCIEKDPKRRLHDIADAWLVFDETAEIAPSRTHKTLSMLTAVFAVAVISLGTSLWRVTRITDPPQPVIRLDLDLGPDASLGSGIGPTAVLSPDGGRLVMVSQGSDGIRRLVTRRLDQPRATALTGSEGAYAPFFSPDAQWVGFFAGGKLKKIPVAGGEPVSLFDAPAGRGASWGEDDSIVAALDSQVGLSRVPAAGGNVTSVTVLQSGENSHRWPQILPGGKAVLFTFNTSFGNFDEAAIAVASLEDHRTKIVMEHAGMYPQYLRSGHLIYVKKSTLFAVPFDLDRLEVRGNPTPILEDLSSAPNFGFAQIVVSRSGAALYRRGRAEGLQLVQWMNGAGQVEPLLSEPALYQFVRLSRDGSRIAMVVPDGQSSVLWIYDWQRGARTRLTIGAGVNTYPVWSPDGQYVVFHSAGGMFSTRADGAGKPQPLTQSKLLQYPGSFSPDGKRLAFSEANAGPGANLRTVALESRDGHLQASVPELFLSLRSVNAYPAFSPDGRWLAYAAAESGIYEVYVRAYPDKGSQWQVSNNGGTMPVWSRNGHELFYRTEDQRIMVTNYVVKGDSFVAEKPRVWSAKPLANLGLTPNFDLAPDGKRFVVVMPAENPEPREAQSHVTLVLNFFDEVRRRATGASQ